jgi:murein DD-endopeptidase MepM/ murein hydrolase activator NlpD
MSRAGFGLLLAVLPGLAGAQAARCVPDLPESVAQGALVVGRIAPHCEVRFGGRKLRVDADGTFVFGVGRDDPPAMKLQAGPEGAAQRTFELRVVPRRWRIERVDGVPESTVNPPPAIAARIRDEQARVARARERDDARQDFRFGFVRPLAGRISGVYGSQRILNGTPKDPHYGLDIAAPTGTPFVAPAGGIVTFAAPDLYLTGGTVLLDHGHGLSSVFIHLSRIDVGVGEHVEQGEVVGAVGATGRASGPHLHWGFNWFGVRLDPGLLLGESSDTARAEPAPRAAPQSSPAR